MDHVTEVSPLSCGSPPPPDRLTEEEAEQFLPREFWPKIDHLVFEDGKPLDRIFTERQQRLLVVPLYASWEGPPRNHRFAAMCNVGLFMGPEIPPQVPDAMLSANVVVHRDPHPRAHHSYLIWVYGKAPDVVIELVSDRRGGELTDKVNTYCQFGVPNYVVYDPERYLGEQVLHIFQINQGQYVPSSTAWFPTLHLGLTLWQGLYEGVEAIWLRWCRQDGSLIPTEEEAAHLSRQQVEEAREKATKAKRDAAKAKREVTKARNETTEAQREAAKAKREVAKSRNETTEAQREAAKAKREAAKSRKEAEALRVQQEQLLAQLRALGVTPNLEEPTP